MSRCDGFTWIGQVGCGGVQIINEVTDIRVMARSRVILAIRGLRKRNKRKHGECFDLISVRSATGTLTNRCALHKHHTPNWRWRLAKLPKITAAAVVLFV